MNHDGQTLCPLQANANSGRRHETARGGRASLTARAALKALRGLQVGHLRLQLPGGEVRDFHGATPGVQAELKIHHWRALDAMARRAEIGLAEAYAAGDCDCHDWVALLGLAQANQQALRHLFAGRWWGKLIYRVQHWLNRNSRSGSRRNIQAHYDLGNAFYRLWLDPGMSYSAAWFGGNDAQPLEEAQTAKYRRILQQLQAKPQANILEVGCGWGGFAELAASDGHQVTGLTLSAQQLAYAEQRLNSAGLEERTRLLLCDYRDHHEQYDHVVSIEMFEAVGEQYWAAYFRQLRSWLKVGGTALIQTITIADEHFDAYRSSTDFIQQYIFPGGMLPSPSLFQRHAEAAGFRVGDSSRFGLDYAETLRRWRQNFERNLQEIRQQGFDETFIRLWRFYLVYCEAGFREGRVNVQQTLLHA